MGAHLPSILFFLFLIYLFLFMAVLVLRFCARAFSSCGKWGPLFIAMRGPLTIAASLVAEHRLQTRRLSNRGSRAQLLRGMWDLPRPGLEPVSPALAGGFSTTAPPGKPCPAFLLRHASAREASSSENTPPPLPQNAVMEDRAFPRIQLFLPQGGYSPDSPSPHRATFSPGTFHSV